MKIGFDLDGTLDRPALRDLALHLLATKQEVYIISGAFPDASSWQGVASKREKLKRLGIPFVEFKELDPVLPWCGDGPAAFCVLDALPATFDRAYRLTDLGLRKGALCERYGITLFFDDSSTYCEMVPKMSGGTLTLKVGEGK